jgi:myosin tail region-interacting protein MTI1
MSTGRAPPPPPPSVPIRSPSPGSESDDEMPGNALAQGHASPTVPSRPFPPVPPAEHSSSVDSLPIRRASEKRPSGGPPPIPVASPPQVRPPPPTPAEAMHARSSKAGADGESEYEGDYDTDIASGAKHKDALKAHARESSLDDSLMTDDVSVRSPPPLPPLPPPAGTRPVPPPPPTQPPGRSSVEFTRPVPPPPVPPRNLEEDDIEYDPYNYSSPPPVGRAPPSVPKVPSAAGPPPVPQRAIEEDTYSDDELYDISPRKPADRPPLPPHQVSQSERSAPPLPPTSPPTSPRITRQSGEEERFFTSRRSTEQGRASLDQGSIARDVDLGQATKWWTQPNTPPPVFQNKPDVSFEFEESQTKQRGGKTTISKDVYVLFHDYSQTVISARYDAKVPEDVILEQRHETAPHQLRQDQLEDYWTRFGSKIFAALNNLANTTVGDGSPHALVTTLLEPLQGALTPVGHRAYGAPVYANLANASTQQYDEIRPGDIVSFRNAKFQGKAGGVVHHKYQLEAGKPDHVGIVVEWDGTKKKIRAAEQGRDVKEGKKGKVAVESFRLNDLRSGEVRVWRVVGREWVGWGE